ncbi:helix-turn-helix transcriptional regulator [Paenibacillus donghaensis]|uniref:Transcriptional regulator n=1 Tax=Paenibacillus donghaensis TaxID=414771 RepID=A0A2Z2KNK9_9BACL|nr:YafY family protein [Paenibacillus donghaensis]ASA25220.1 transcriptional regulator [Paenibacillus donghaensis]
MSKAKRLLELMMTVNRKRKFTVKELAAEFNVSSRTILRDLQELGELGVPLYSEVGPHGGYQVLKERILPPIAFTEEEAVAIFFASHALRHYTSLPFKTEAAAALQKFYNYMSGEVRDRIDEMKNRIDFLTPAREAGFPYLSLLLEAAIQQTVIHIDYESRGVRTERAIQPIGIYASNGLWYCPAHCFVRGGIRIFRCDRIHAAAAEVTGISPLNLRHVHLGNKESFMKQEQALDPHLLMLHVELDKEGVHRCEGEIWSSSLLQVREDRTGWLEGTISGSELDFFAGFIIGLGKGVTVQKPPELVEKLKELLAGLLEKYM